MMWGDDVEDDTGPDHAGSPTSSISSEDRPLLKFNVKLLASGVPLYLPPALEVDENQVEKDWNSILSRWTDQTEASHPVRYQKIPQWLRRPEPPPEFGVIATSVQPFEVARVRGGMRSLNNHEVSAVESMVQQRPWEFYPWVEDRGAFCVSHTHGMARGALFSVGPVGYRRFGPEQVHPRKLYFSSPGAYRKWVEKYYC